MSSKLLLGIVCLATIFTVGQSKRIVGGRPAKEGEFPFQVSLRRSYNDEHFCGGIIITPLHILTAAHCMFYQWGGRLPNYVVSVVAGQLGLPITESDVYRNASKIIVHENFDRKTMFNDVAVIELDIQLPTNSNKIISTIPMRETPVSTGACTVSGWGHTDYRICGEPPESQIVSELLLTTEVNLIEFSKCNTKYANQLSESMLCAGVEKGGKDACQGDSGGPLVCDGLLTGVVSTGCGCAEIEFPGIYSDVAKFLPWIKDKISSNTSTSTHATEIINIFTNATIEPIHITETAIDILGHPVEGGANLISESGVLLAIILILEMFA